MQTNVTGTNDRITTEYHNEYFQCYERHSVGRAGRREKRGGKSDRVSIILVSLSNQQGGNRWDECFYGFQWILYKSEFDANGVFIFVSFVVLCYLYSYELFRQDIDFFYDFQFDFATRRWWRK